MLLRRHLLLLLGHLSLVLLLSHMSLVLLLNQLILLLLLNHLILLLLLNHLSLLLLLHHLTLLRLQLHRCGRAGQRHRGRRHHRRDGLLNLLLGLRDRRGNDSPRVAALPSALWRVLDLGMSVTLKFVSHVWLNWQQIKRLTL